MHFYDWLIVIIPVACVIGVALHCRRYSRGVVDFLAAGRVARRFVLTTGSLAADLSLLGLVATVESKYLVGYGMAFWEILTMPVGIILVRVVLGREIAGQHMLSGLFRSRKSAS